MIEHEESVYLCDIIYIILYVYLYVIIFINCDECVFWNLAQKASSKLDKDIHTI